MACFFVVDGAGLERFDKRQNRGQRRAQLMRNIGKKLLPHMLKPLDARDIDENAQGPLRLLRCRRTRALRAFAVGTSERHHAKIKNQTLWSMSFNLDAASFGSLQRVKKGAIDRGVARQLGQPLRIELARERLNRRWAAVFEATTRMSLSTTSKPSRMPFIVASNNFPSAKVSGGRFLMRQCLCRCSFRIVRLQFSLEASDEQDGGDEQQENVHHCARCEGRQEQNNRQENCAGGKQDDVTLRHDSKTLVAKACRATQCL